MSTIGIDLPSGPDRRRARRHSQPLGSLRVAMTDRASPSCWPGRCRGRATHRRLGRVAVEDPTRALRLLSDRRDELVADRTLSRLQVLLGDLHPGGAEPYLTAQRAAALLGRLRPVARVDREPKRIAGEFLADLRRLDQLITAATKATGEAVTASGTTRRSCSGWGRCLPPRSWAMPAT